MKEPMESMRRRLADLSDQYKHTSQHARALFDRLNGTAPVDTAPVSAREYRYYADRCIVLRAKMDQLSDAITMAEVHSMYVKGIA